MARLAPQTQDKYILRMPDGLRDRLKEAAAKDNRSLNAELVYRLDNWDDVLEQLNLTHAGWEESRIQVEQKNEHIHALQVELGESASRYDNLYDRYRQHRDQAALELAENHIPNSLMKRIQRRARVTGRKPREELILALEAAFPPPVPSLSFIGDLGFTTLVWRKGQWDMVDWDTFGRFRSGDNSTTITLDRDRQPNTYLVVAVLGDKGDLLNIITHNYLVNDAGYRSVAASRLTPAESDEYRQLMINMAPTEEDHRRLSFLQSKMEPALTLPPDSIPLLREKLIELATENTVDDVLCRRGLAPPGRAADD